MSNPELQALLANLRPRSQTSVSNLSRERSREPSASIHTTQIPSTPPPPFSPLPSQRSPVTSGSAVAQNLLNLLNFHQSTPLHTDQLHESSSQRQAIQNSSTRQEQEGPVITNERVSDHSSISRNGDELNLDHQHRHLQNQGETSTNSAFQASVRSLNDPINRATDPHPEPAKESTSELGKTSTVTDPQNRSVQEMDHGQQGLEGLSVQDKPLFTYKNPFEALKASRTIKPSPAQADLQHQAQQSLPSPPENHENHDTVQTMNEVVADRVKLTPKSRASRPLVQQPSNMNNTDDAAVLNAASDSNRLSEHALASVDHNAAGQANGQSEEDRMIPDQKITVATDNEILGHAKHEGRLVPVLTFPVKAFVSITLQPSEASKILIREEGVREISRLKKDFDQLDRSLAMASSTYITYAFVKNGGMRIIRQDDGSDRHVFKNSHDRIFNVSMSTSSMSSPPFEHQAVLGTGISGAVYYATLSRPGRDMFETDELTTESFIFPAHPQADENTAGGILKTRAKRSSRHPEFFAIGRGKAIHLIWPATVMSSRYGITDNHRTVDIEKLFSERPLQILTGKAGKDFTFSEDDTMIVSLDKTGRLRFWDIRKLIDEENAKSVHITPYVIDTPILSLSTASPAEKSWPTSVLFVDKARPYVRGGPLRYVLVGLRQNHTLQLWDIALGKAVQEINFPHESETDGICSVSYHSGSGIIAVGHPTRNSIYFIHLSAPRYILSSSLSQASYVQRVAAKSPGSPQPESTACMSGIREISFGARGHIRSIELLPVYEQSENSPPNAETEALFELYIVHSKGATCLAINREDLGWNAENKVLHAIDAESERLVVLRELRLGNVIEEHAESKSPVPESNSQPKPTKKKPKKPKDLADEVTPSGILASTINTGEVALSKQIDPDPLLETSISKQHKKTKKKPSFSDCATSKSDVLRGGLVDNDVATQHPTEHASSKFTPTHLEGAGPQMLDQSPSVSTEWLENQLRMIEKSVNTEFRKELELLYQNIRSDRTSLDDASLLRQEAMLRLVSSTLDNNVEKSLARIIASQMQDVVVPSVVQSMCKTITNNVTEITADTIQRELANLIPVHLEQTLQSPQMLLGIANNITQRLTAHVQGEITKTLNNSIASNMKSIATRAANEVFNGYEARMAEQFRNLQLHNQSQISKVEQLHQNMEMVLATVQTIAKAQADLGKQMQEQLHTVQGHINNQNFNHENVNKLSTNFLKENDSMNELSRHLEPISVASASNQMPTQALPQRTQADLDLEEISYLMEHERYEEGSIKWLQSTAPHKIFDELFVRYTPDYLATDVSSLVAFSIGVTLANEPAVNTQQRLEWINAAFNTVDLQDREIIELSQHAPQLINGVIIKLESLYGQRASLNHRDPILDSIQTVAKKAQELKYVFDTMNSARGQPHIID